MPLEADLKRHAERVLKDAESGRMTANSERARAFMEDHPDAALSVVDLIAREGGAKEPNDHLMQACALLFSWGVELLRYEAEDGHRRATGLIEEIRARLLKLVRDDSVSVQVPLILTNALVGAKIAPGTELTNALGERAAESAASEASDQPEALGAVIEALLAEVDGNEFDLLASLNEVSQALPPQFRCTMVEMGLYEKQPVLREAAVLGLLDPAPEVRETACRLIAQGAPVSPVGLRRMIAIRNWLPQDERPRLDAAIARARRDRVACASWPRAAVETILATQMDGAGAQSAFAVVKDGRRRLVAGLLVKLGAGIADAWCLRGQTRAEVREILDDITIETEALPVGRNFLDLVVPHFLAVGLEAGAVPPAGLLDVVEALGIEAWQPAALSAEALIALLEEGADALPPQMGMLAVRENGSDTDEGSLLEEFALMQSWYEDDAEVAALLDKRLRSSPSVRVEAVLDSILEPRRDKWAERFLWTALWLRHAADPPLPWTDFFAVGRALHEGRRVKDIPVMREIAEATVETHALRN